MEEVRISQETLRLGSQQYRVDHIVRVFSDSHSEAIWVEQERRERRMDPKAWATVYGFLALGAIIELTMTDGIVLGLLFLLATVVVLPVAVLASMTDIRIGAQRTKKITETHYLKIELSNGKVRRVAASETKSEIELLLRKIQKRMGERSRRTVVVSTTAAIISAEEPASVHYDDGGY